MKKEKKTLIDFEVIFTGQWGVYIDNGLQMKLSEHLKMILIPNSMIIIFSSLLNFSGNL